MKKPIALFSLIVLLIFACKDKDELLTFKLSVSEEFTVPAFQYVVDTVLTVNVNDIPTNSDKLFKDNGTSSDFVKDIKLSAMSITIVSPTSQNLDFLKTISIYISADGLSEILLASKTTVPTGITTLDLDVSGEAMDDYIKGDFIDLKVETGADETLPQDTELKTDMEFSITANPL
ncbi:MAG: hypothetical protein COA57_03200 [Flavobacteriales bacterium]|nr:MAG: hypothetical protein COA57_03200 [Flavobacteriales bacterium]